MKRYALILTFWWAGVAWLSAQVTVEIVLDQEQFLQDESLPLKVRITNRSGQLLHLGQDKDWLKFTVERRDGRITTRLGDVPVQGDFLLDSSKVADRLVDLMPYYDLEPGRYHVTAVVKIPQWKEEVSSPPKLVDVIRGTKIWEQVVGVPAPDGIPDARKYILEQANYLRRLYLYLRLTDRSEHVVYRVLPIGQLVSFGRPEAQTDRESRLHVLFQTGARSFTYCVVDTEGKIALRQRHDYAATRPVLKSDGEGHISVKGGMRRLTKWDVPAPSLANKTNDIQAPVP
jgi:hypothetical protein